MSFTGWILCALVGLVYAPGPTSLFLVVAAIFWIAVIINGVFRLTGR